MGRLLAGVAEIDITPPVGTALAGSIWPRRSEGIQDPLYVKAIVLESKGVRLAMAKAGGEIMRAKALCKVIMSQISFSEMEA